MARSGHPDRVAYRQEQEIGPKDSTMWDTVQDSWGQTTSQDACGEEHLSHDRPCVRCGHAMHTFLACDASCGCEPVSVPVRVAG